MNKKRKIIMFSMIFAIGIIMILNYKFNIIEKMTKIGLKNEETIKISYQVYDNSTENKLKTLITINDIDGIDYVEYSDGNKVNGNKKDKMSFDYVMDKDQNYTFKIKSIDNDKIQEYTVCADEQFVNDYGVGINKLKDEEGYKVIEITNNIDLNDFKTYYQIGENSDWIEGTEKIGLLDYDLTKSKLVNEDNTITINAKIVNSNTNNTVNLSKKFNVNTNSTTNEFEADSLLSAIDSYDLDTGIYKINVNGETYNLKIYSFNNDLEISADTSFGTEEDVANKEEYAKNMVVLKVKGNLTIDENSIITSYASKNGYGGTKGMMVYCTGTLTNNGIISMTARGAKAEGQNVYLWKNSDNSYEFVPSDGAEGGKGSSSVYYEKGKNGNNGINRQTGGGGSGEVTFDISGSGQYGTSYSGGTGGRTGVIKAELQMDRKMEVRVAMEAEAIVLLPNLVVVALEIQED